MQRLPNWGADHTSDERTALPLIAPTVHHASGPSYPFGGSNARVQPFDLSPASGGSRNSRPSCPCDKPDSHALGPGPSAWESGLSQGQLGRELDRKSTSLNSSHVAISYAV